MPSDSVNKVILVGRIAREPRWHNKNGDKVLCFTLETEESFMSAGKPATHIETHHIQLQFKSVQQNLCKGQLLHVEGRIKTSIIVDEQQVKRYQTNIDGAIATVLLDAPERSNVKESTLPFKLT